MAVPMNLGGRTRHHRASCNTQQAKHCLHLHSSTLLSFRHLHKFLRVQASSCKSKPYCCSWQNSSHSCNLLNGLSHAKKKKKGTFFASIANSSAVTASVATATLAAHAFSLPASYSSTSTQKNSKFRQETKKSTKQVSRRGNACPAGLPVSPCLI